MKQVSSKEAIRKLTGQGWTVARQSGSHVTLTKPAHPLIITVPHPRKTLSPGVTRDIEKKAGFRF